jgi:hypothetical protein
MNIGNRTFLSDTFFNAKPPDFYIGYVCEDTLLLEWMPINGIGNYRIYALGDTLLQPIGTTPGTAFKIAATTLKNDLVTVAALSHQNPAYEYRANSKIISFQGVECYFKNFFGQWDNGSAILSFSLGTTYNIASAFLQKLQGTGFATIHIINPVNSTEYNYTDRELTEGANTYRVVLNLTDGRTVVSNTETLIHSNPNGWWVFPNPVKRNGQLNITNRWSETETLFADIYDVNGRKTSIKAADLIDNSFSVSNLSPGMYLLVFHDGKNRLGTEKLIILP